MKFKIPEDFMIQTSTGFVEYEYGERTLLTARTREGKTLLTLFLLSSVRVHDPDTVVIMFGPNMTNFVDDIRSKIEFFEEFQSLGVRASSFSKEDREDFMAELAGVSTQPTILVVNSDYQHISKIIPYLQKLNRKVIAVIDEAHKGGEQTYRPLLRDLRMSHIAVIETTATFRNRLLTSRPAKYISSLCSNMHYTNPTSAHQINFSHNEYTYRNQRLHKDQIDFVLNQQLQERSLVLINGYDKTAFHYAARQQLKAAINRSDVAIITLNGGGAYWTTADSSDISDQLFNKSTPIRAASSAVSAVYERGFKHIVVIGQKQVAEGQTVGCSGLSLSGQIVGTPISKQNADALTQTIRTGGLNISSTQTVLIEDQRWRDYQIYVQANEELSIAFQNKSPEEQQRIAEEAYLALPTLKIQHGDYSPVKGKADASNVISHYFEIKAIDRFKPMFDYGAKNTAELYTAIREAIKAQPWYDNHPLQARKIRNPDQHTAKGGNDIQAHVNADPTSAEVRVHPTVFWLRGDVIAVRTIHSYEPGLTHNYYGNLESFVKKDRLVLL